MYWILRPAAGTEPAPVPFHIPFHCNVGLMPPHRLTDLLVLSAVQKGSPALFDVPPSQKGQLMAPMSQAVRPPTRYSLDQMANCVLGGLSLLGGCSADGFEFF